MTMPRVARTPIQRTTENFPIAPIRRMRRNVTATQRSDAAGASHPSGIPGNTKRRYRANPMAPEAIESGAEKTIWKRKRNDTSFPHRSGPYASRRNA